ncbi:CHAT domain-containing protein [Sphaerospermopsis sp. LEGE 08334]|uniref:CHAT domain-containing protein n=1 Tax=Sphaerospermopsis sp. LEGE 08334 TaxID=1828651 RepID=UPI001880FD2B|nr:CHAT domain-containing protein [Sphaerospermopsis sp. LEGE 08334]MBE9058138.1 CHAT domain-containing protein [Sphaerospermopsis sp. LEGE 08334]
MNNFKITPLSLISQLTSTCIIILATISIPVNTVQANNISHSPHQKSTYNQLQKNLIHQNQLEAALEISERSRNGGFWELLTSHKSHKIAKSLSSEEIKQVAKKQNATIVQYSIINDEFVIAGKKQTQESELLIWVIQPTGEIALRQVNLKPLWQKENTSLSDLVAESRLRMGARHRNNKEIKVVPTEEHIYKKHLQKLHEILIQPIADLLPNQPDKHIIFIPQGDLFFVPFAALQDKKGQYLIEKHTIATAPSIQVLDLLYQRKRQNQGLVKDVLIVGNPIMPTKPLQPGENPPETFNLPGAEQEAKQIAGIFNTQALTGKAATETAIVQRMPQAKIIHLAVSNVRNKEGEFSDVLALGTSEQDDGWLTSEEIINLNLKAELVVLSGNDTAIGKVTNDGVIGLSRSFFTAGATSVIGSLWSVSDRETVFLMTEFYQELSKNPDQAAALRQAMLTTMKKYPNPMSWASFILIGDG